MKTELIAQYAVRAGDLLSYSVFGTLGVLLDILPENQTHVEIRGNEGDMINKDAS
jgi:hypothetical protein